MRRQVARRKTRRKYLLGKEFLEFLGASTLLVLILGVFWKGDEALSKQARNDIGAWLLRLKPPSEGSSPVGQSVLAMFERVFGTKHWSLRCWAMSACASMFFLVVFVAYQQFIFVDQLTASNPSIITFQRNATAALVVLIVVASLFNVLGDYLSLLVTRRVLNRLANNSIGLASALVLDTLLSIAVFIVSVWSAFGFVILIGSSEAVLLLFTMQNGFGISENDIELAILMRGVIITNFITSIWLWAAALGTFVIRLLARGGPVIAFFQYLLPIADKPVRSMGIVGFLSLLGFLLVREGARAIL